VNILVYVHGSAPIRGSSRTTSWGNFATYVWLELLENFCKLPNFTLIDSK
jgi:hypothetical protein